MLKLIKQLRPYTWAILIIFVLLFGQAMADLALPGFMSNIVNVGIQQGGIETAVPEAIRASEYDKVTLLMTEGEKSQVSAAYVLLDKQTLSPSDYSNYVKSYPQLANTPVYKLNTSDNAQLAQLDAIFSTYLPVVYGIEQNRLPALSGGLQIPPGTDPFAVLAQLTPAQLTDLRSAIASQTAAVPASLLKGSATAFLQDEYKALGISLSGIQTSYMLRIGLLMLLLTLASAAASVAVGFISARIAAGLGRDLRRRLFVRVQEFSNTEFDKFSTASLISRSTNDITQIQMLMVMLFRIMFYAPILGIGGIIRVAGVDTSMLWTIAVAVAAIMTMMIVMFAVAIPKFQLVQKLVDRLNLVTREMLTGLMVIRAFNTQKYEEKKFDSANAELTGTSLFINRVLVFLMPAMMLLMNLIMLLIVWVGSHQVDAGTLQVGDMMAFTQYAMQIIFSFLMISVVFVMVPRAAVSAERISEVLETDPVIKDPEKAVSFNENLKGVVEFRNVFFRYPGAEADVLKRINFTAQPGRTTAFIGSTGSGKSTLINLIPRFYDVTDGQVLIDGVDVRSVTQRDLRGKIGYVPQKAVLFTGTIGSNIRYGNETASESDVARYAETAQALDFISTSEHGYGTSVSQGGSNLSGGQKQRLAIARALARKPEVFIFDDSLSALDFKTDAALRKALKKETSDATVLIVTQRVSTVMGADQIVVLDNGEIAGLGTHTQLMENCSVYREIALSQLSKEELA